MGYGNRWDYSQSRKINLDKVYHDIIKPVVEECGFRCIRGDEVLDSGLIDDSIYYGILESDLVIADISTLNPNAIYELGVRHGVKKYRTIIMMESKDKFFFDLNHNRTLTYSYSSQARSFKKEVVKVKDRLKNLINEIDKNEQVDSPLYKFVTDLQEPVRQKMEVSVAKEGKPIYERIKEATDLRRQAKFEGAIALFEELSKDIPSDPYFKQQLALCTYKSAKPSPMEALNKALDILTPLSESIDPETNGLLGAIYKRKFFVTNDEKYLTKAIYCYKKAYNLFDDYYNGENYAFCLLLQSTLTKSKEESREFYAMAKHLYREIYEANIEVVEEEVNTEYEVWLLATLATCALVINKKEQYEKYESLFLAKANKMMKSSYSIQNKRLLKILGKSTVD